MPNGCSNDVLRPRIGRKKKPVFVFRTSNIVESDLLLWVEGILWWCVVAVGT